MYDTGRDSRTRSSVKRVDRNVKCSESTPGSSMEKVVRVGLTLTPTARRADGDGSDAFPRNV
eukprot:4116716-Prymnesium_polylepis.2